MRNKSILETWYGRAKPDATNLSSSEDAMLAELVLMMMLSTQPQGGPPQTKRKRKRNRVPQSPLIPPHAFTKPMMMDTVGIQQQQQQLGMMTPPWMKMRRLAQSAQSHAPPAPPQPTAQDKMMINWEFDFIKRRDKPEATPPLSRVKSRFTSRIYPPHHAAQT
jgi:hypothetical protein